ncbi:hypothetical protein ZIOFF_021085 [Zingiber officinale]|uniref:Uncharacterized protein n=1 Tax=Zingiber officinale TaxID=94328 RepID=A0A8J5H3C2_ZINOF|nr:hypothetical protein ZIOFF_021085 [Zingiber officinale]
MVMIEKVTVKHNLNGFPAILTIKLLRASQWSFMRPGYQFPVPKFSVFYVMQAYNFLCVERNSPFKPYHSLDLTHYLPSVAMLAFRSLRAVDRLHLVSSHGKLSVHHRFPRDFSMEKRPGESNLIHPTAIIHGDVVLGQSGAVVGADLSDLVY